MIPPLEPNWDHTTVSSKKSSLFRMRCKLRSHPCRAAKNDSAEVRTRDLMRSLVLSDETQLM